MALGSGMTTGQKGGVVALAGGAAGAAGAGLSQAAAAAGDVLRSIFGGLPWNMDPSGIVNTVTGGSSAIVPYATDAAAVLF